MMSADSTGSLTTSAHPAALRRGSLKRVATMTSAANAATIRSGSHPRRLEILLWYIWPSHKGAEFTCEGSVDQTRPTGTSVLARLAHDPEEWGLASKQTVLK